MILNRKILLDTLIRHETLTGEDIAKEVNLGMVPDPGQLKYLLWELTKGGYFCILQGHHPCTYTITDKGIMEGKRLQ